MTPPPSPPISTKVFKESQDIAAEVQAASNNFETLQQDVKLIISDLKAQHSAMIDLSEKRLETALRFETFVSKTPLSHLVAGDCGSKPEPKAPLVDYPKEKEKEKKAEIPEAAPEKQGTKATIPTKEDEKKKEADTTKKEDSKKEAKDSGEATKEVSEKAEGMLDEKTVEEDKENAETAQTETAAVKKKGVEKEKSQGKNKETREEKEKNAAQDSIAYLDIVKNVKAVSEKYAAKYDKEVIGYAQDWLKAVSDRIKARQLQFQELKQSYEHYAKKVEGLTPKKPLSPGRRQERLERNELKLRGAREAFDNAGESLLLLLEEVTERAWKDFYPLFKKQMLFDTKYEAELANVYAKLAETIPKLEEVGDKHKLKAGGRLDSIEKLHPEELYTGTKNVVRPVLETPKEDDDDRASL